MNFAGVKLEEDFEENIEDSIGCDRGFTLMSLRRPGKWYVVPITLTADCVPNRHRPETTHSPEGKGGGGRSPKCEDLVAADCKLGGHLPRKCAQVVLTPVLLQATRRLLR